MSTPISNLQQMIAGMDPVLNPGAYAYCNLAVASPDLLAAAVVMVRESEGLTLVLPLAVARAQEMPILLECRWLTLKVHSDLAACGLTAAFARALADVGISCNVIAGAYHDHLFVPTEQAESALVALRQLQASAR